MIGIRFFGSGELNQRTFSDEQYYPRDGLVYVERWQRHLLQRFRNLQSQNVSGGTVIRVDFISFNVVLFNFFESIWPPTDPKTMRKKGGN